MPKIHIWHRHERYKCGRAPKVQDWKGPHVPRHEAGKATCLNCLRSVQSFGLWELESLSAEVKAATEQLDKLTRAKARKRGKQESGQ